MTISAANTEKVCSGKYTGRDVTRPVKVTISFDGFEKGKFMKMLPGIFRSWFVLLAFILVLGGCSDGSKPVRLKGKAIGTYYSVVAYGVPQGISADDLSKGIDKVVSDINSVMSLFEKDSELSRFNAYQKSDWFPVSAEMEKVVQTAKDVNRETGGVFDITIAPLVNLWGFGPDKRPEKIPSEAEIKTAISEMGSQYIETRLQPPAIRKLNPDITLDLAAIAKGYCVDKVSNWLEKQGVTASMVEIGGEIRTRGMKPDGSLWRIAVEKPVSMERSVEAVIAFTDKSMATSGDYRNYFEDGGIRYSHIIDPTTGRPISHKLVSVSVMDDTCIRADALATGLMVLGPEKGVEFAKKMNLPAFFIVKTSDGFAEFVTGNFPKHEKLN